MMVLGQIIDNFLFTGSKSSRTTLVFLAKHQKDSSQPWLRLAFQINYPLYLQQAQDIFSKIVQSYVILEKKIIIRIQ